jgi:hypothetical protein
MVYFFTNGDIKSMDTDSFIVKNEPFSKQSYYLVLAATLHSTEHVAINTIKAAQVICQ